MCFQNEFICFSENDNSSIKSDERKSLSNFSKKTHRNKFNENLPTRQHSLRSCRNPETSYKIPRNQTKRIRTNSSSSSNNSMITCANISLQRKLYKQILIAESDGKLFEDYCLFSYNLLINLFSCWLWSVSWITYSISWRFDCRIYRRNNFRRGSR